MGATMAEAKLAAVEAYDQGAVDENGNRLTLNKLLNQEKRKRGWLVADNYLHMFGNTQDRIEAVSGGQLALPASAIGIGFETNWSPGQWALKQDASAPKRKTDAELRAEAKKELDDLPFGETTDTEIDNKVAELRAAEDAKIKAYNDQIAEKEDKLTQVLREFDPTKPMEQQIGTLVKG